MLIDKLEGVALDVAIVSALGYEFDAYNENITIIERVDHGVGMPDEIRTRRAPKYHEDINTANELLERFVIDHRLCIGPDLYCGYYFQITVSQKLIYTVMLCFIDSGHRVVRYAVDARSMDRSLAIAMCRTWLKSLKMLGKLDYITMFGEVGGVNTEDKDSEIDANKIIADARTALVEFKEVK